MMEFTAEMIAGFLGGDIVGDKTVKVHTVSSIEEGKAGSMAYLVNPKYEPFLYTTEASIVLVDRSFTPQREVKPTLVKVDDAGAAVLRLLEMYNAARPQKKGVSERASISPEASLGEGCYVGDFAVIEAGARIDVSSQKEDPLDFALWKGAKPGEIAERVGKCQATIYRELERGKTGETDSRFRQGYSAAVAEARVNRSYRNRGRRKAAQ